MKSQIFTIFILGFLIFSTTGRGYAQNPTEYGYLQIPDTTKWQAQLNDSLVSNSPVNIITLSPGMYSLVLSPKNIKDWRVVSIRQEITIVAGDTLVPELSEIPLDNAVIHDFRINTETHIQSPVIFSDKNRKSNRYFRPVLILTAVTSNWAAFYLKRKADDYYSAYTKTSDLSKIQKNYDRAAQFDVYSTVMLGVSAGTLLTYMYLLLTD
jgi:hypothetical protein